MDVTTFFRFCDEARRTTHSDGNNREVNVLFTPLLDALTSLLAVMGDDVSFPQPETIHAGLSTRSGVSFERQSRQSRRCRTPKDPAQMYDTRISKHSCVPTRPDSLHDLLNALVWGTFPHTKRALHARQHRLIVPSVRGESARRSAELDALALFDEGGVVVVSQHTLVGVAESDVEGAIAAGDAAAMLFGHAIYEGLTLDRPAPLASVICVAIPEGAAAATSCVDVALAEVIRDRSRLASPSDMQRIRVDQRLAKGRCER